MRFDSLLTVVFVLFALYFGRSSSNNAHKFMQVRVLARGRSLFAALARRPLSVRAGCWRRRRRCGPCDCFAS
jgi:hypothetical protein